MVMKMEEGLDTGPVAMAERVPIAPDATAGDLHDALAPLGADLMVRALGALERGALTLHAAGGRRRRPTRRRSTRPRPASTGRGRGSRCTTTSAACRRFPAPGSRSLTASRCASRSCARTRGEGAARARPARCSMTGSRSPAATARCASSNCSAPARRAMTAEEFLRGTPLAAGTRLG